MSVMGGSGDGCFFYEALDVEVADVCFSDAQGLVLTKNRQNWLEIYRISINPSLTTMSAMGGSGGGECFAPICAHVSRRHVHSVIS